MIHKSINTNLTFLVQSYLFAIAMNIALFAFMGFDKRQARRGKERIPENVLLGMAVLGGALGGVLAMRKFHHKTRKPKFYIGFPFCFVLNIAVVVFLGILTVNGLI